MAKDFFESIIENTSDGFLALNNRLEVVYFNRTSEKILGKSADDVLGRNLFDSFSEALGTEFERHFQEAIIDRNPRIFDACYNLPPAPNWYEVRVFPGEEGISVYFHAITQKKLEHEKLALQAQLLQAVNSAVIATDKNNRIIYWNNAATALYGWKSEDVYGHDILEITPHETNRAMAADIMRSLIRGKRWSSDFLVKKKNGEVVPVFVTNSPFYDEEGNFAGIIGVSNDISERKKQEKLLLENQLLIKNQANEYQTINEELVQINEELSGLLDELKERNDHINALINAIPDIIFVLNKAGLYLDCHTSDLDSLIYKPEDIIGKTLKQTLPHHLAEQATHSIQLVIKTGHPEFFQYELEIRNKKRAFEARMVKFGEDKVLAMVREITEIKQAEQALKESEEKFRNVVNFSPLAKYLYKLELNNNLILVDANPAADKILGINHQQLIGKTIEKAFPKLKDTDIPQLYKKIARGELNTQTFEIKYTDDRFSGYYLVNAFSTGINSIAVEFIDISDKKNSEDALKESNQKYQNLVNTTQSVIFHVSANGIFQFVSPSVYEHVGYTPEELIGTHYKIFIHPDDIDLIDKYIEKKIADSNVTPDLEYRVFHKNGSRRWHRSVITPVTDENENLISIIGNAIDVTERVKTEKELQESEERYRSLYENATIGIYRTSFGGKIIMANPALTKMLGYDTLEELQQRSLDSNGYLPEYPRTQFRELIEGDGMIRGMESAWITKEGETKHLLESAWIVRDKTGVPLYYEGIVEDVTQQKNVLLALNKSEENYRQIFEKSPLGILQCDKNGIVNELNERLSEIIGTPREYLMGKNIREHPDAGITDNLEIVFNKKETAIFEGNFTSISSGKITPVRAIFSPVMLKKDDVSGIIIIVEDRSAHIQREELERQAAVASESVRFKQNFLANMSHEIRTPLTGVLGMVEILSNTSLDEVQKEYLAILKNSGDNLREIINQVLDFSKIEAGKVSLQPREFDLRATFENARKLFAGKCSYKGLEFNYTVDPKIPALIVGDNLRLSQIINNLISNAIKFTDNGSISISSTLDLTNHSDTCLMIRVEIKDTGIGINPEKLNRLFIPFGQIDENDIRNYEGSGLGLSICKELVGLMNGEIGVESTPGQGSNFWFTFLAQKPGLNKHSEPLKRSENQPAKRSLNILLAEDKVVNQKVIGIMLNHLNHIVTIAENGKQVLELFKPGVFDLILMDIQMPLMDGIKATHALKQKYSDLPPIVGLSANAFEGDREKYMQMGLDDYITKPLRSSDFEDLIVRLFYSQF